MPSQDYQCMKINLILSENSFSIEDTDIKSFSNYNRISISVKCGQPGMDELLLKKAALSFLNSIAKNEGVMLQQISDRQSTIPVRVNKGESARIKYIEFSAEVLPL